MVHQPQKVPVFYISHFCRGLTLMAYSIHPLPPFSANSWGPIFCFVRPSSLFFSGGLVPDGGRPGHPGPRLRGGLRAAPGGLGAPRPRGHPAPRPRARRAPGRRATDADGRSGDGCGEAEALDPPGVQGGKNGWCLGSRGRHGGRSEVSFLL